MSHNATLHIYDNKFLHGVKISRLAQKAGIRSEIYTTVDQIIQYAPSILASDSCGIILAHDDKAQYGAIDVLSALAQSGYSLPVIAFSEIPDIQNVVRTIKFGAIDYIHLPKSFVVLREVISRTIRDAETQIQKKSESKDARIIFEKLTKRELEVLDFISRGFKNKIIAERLSISPRTVEVHRLRMMQKIGATNAAAAIRFYLDFANIYNKFS